MRKSVLIDRVAKLQAAVIAARNAVIPVATCSSLLAMGAEPARLVDHFFGWRPTEPDLQDLFQIVQATTAMRLTCRMMMRARYGLKYLTDLIRSFPMHQLHLYTKTMSITTCMAEFGATGQQLRHEMCHVAHMDTPARIFRMARAHNRFYKCSSRSQKISNVQNTPSNVLFDEMVFLPSPRILSNLTRFQAHVACVPPGDRAHVGGNNSAVLRIARLMSARDRRKHAAKTKRDIEVVGLKKSKTN